MYRNVVDAVIYQVAADRVVDLHLESHFQFCAYAIHARNQHGIDILLVHGKQAAESANLAQHSLGESFVSQIFNALLSAVATIDVDTGVGVSNGVVFGGILSHFSVRRCQG